MINNSCTLIPRVNLLNEIDERSKNELVFSTFTEYLEREDQDHIEICCDYCYVVPFFEKYFNLR